VLLVDSTVWIDYFNGQATPQTDHLDGILSPSRGLWGYDGHHTNPEPGGSHRCKIDLRIPGSNADPTIIVFQAPVDFGLVREWELKDFVAATDFCTSAEVIRRQEGTDPITPSAR
jgi:hypothetical protein